MNANKKTFICIAMLAMAPSIVNADWGWSTDIRTLSATGAKSSNIRLASDPTGNVHSIWSQGANTESGSNESWLIQSSRFNFKQEYWTSAVTLGETGRGPAYPSLAFDNERGWALWRYENGGGEKIQAAMFGAGQWTQANTISAGDRSAADPAVITDGAGGFAGIWRTNPEPGVIQSTQTINSGLQWSSPLHISPANQSADYQVILKDEAGVSPTSTIILWRAQVGAGKWAIMSSRSDQPGVNETVYGPVEHVSDIRAASDEAGNIIAVWQSSTTENDRVIQSARRSKGQWSQPVSLSTPGKIAFSPAVAAKGSNNVTVLWVLDDDTDMRVQGARYENDAWSKPVDLGRAGPSNPAHEAGWPQVAADSNGQAIAIWQTRESWGVNVQSARFASGQWSQTLYVGAGGQDNAFPQIVAAGHDQVGGTTVIAAWVRDGQVVSTRGSENPDPKYSITLVKSGDGKVVSDPEGIDCGTTCNATFAKGQYVFLFATPGPGKVVGGWSGDCAKFIGPPTQSCTLSMNGNKRVGVTFRDASAKTRTVNAVLKGNGKGGITSDPAGLTCSNDPQGSIICNAQIADFEENTRVSLTATAASGSYFANWSGACTGKNPVCTFKVGKGNKVIKATATFQLNPTLTVENRGTGGGIVTSDIAGIHCGNTCSATFDKGAMVTLTATPLPGSRFTGWGGACSGKRDVCRVTLGKSKTVVAKWIGMAMSGNDVVPEFCIQESPRFNAAQCLQLQEGVTNIKP